MPNYKQSLKATISAAALCLGSLTLHPASAEELQKDRYGLRLTTQIFEGRTEFSHTQFAGLARIRNGNQSYVQLDYHDGAVAVDRQDALEVAAFRNESAQEAAFLYDYTTHTVSGGNDISDNFNTYIRPLMAGNAVPGQDASWSRAVSLHQIGLKSVSNGDVDIVLSRKYFTHEGRDLVLITYDIPVFEYTAQDGTPVIHWGQSAALLNKDMSKAYWNASLHRAVAGETLQETRPYRYVKTIAMSDESGKPVLDIRNIPLVWNTFTPYYNEAATGPMPFSNSDVAGQSPLKVAVQLDILGLALAENSGNQLSEITDQSQNGDRGQEIVDDTVSGAGYATKGNEALKNILPKDKITYEYLSLKKSNLAAGWSAYEEKSSDFVDAIVDAELELTSLGSDFGTAKDRINNLESLQNADLQRLSNLSKNTNMVPSEYRELADLQKQIQNRSKTISELVETADDLAAKEAVATLNLRNLESQFKTLQSEGRALGEAIVAWEIEAEISGNSSLVKGSFVEKLPGPLRSALSSSKAKTLAKFGDNLITTAGDLGNIYTTAKAGVNVIDAATSDKGTGEVDLIRDYSAKGILIDLPLDIGGLFLSAVTGDIKGAFSDGLAITTGSIADIFVSAKSLKDTRAIELDALKQTGALEASRFEQSIGNHEARIAAADFIVEVIASDIPQSEKDRIIAEVNSLLNEVLREEVRENGKIISSRVVGLDTIAGKNRLDQLKQQFGMALREETLSQRANDADSDPKKRKELADRVEREREEFRRALEEERRQKAEEERRKREQEAASTSRAPVKKPTFGGGSNYPTADRSSKSEPAPTSPTFNLGGAGRAAEVAGTVLGDLRDLELPIDLGDNFDLDEYQKRKLAERKRKIEEWRKNLREDPKGDLIGADVRLWLDEDAMLFGEYDIRHLIFTSIDWNAPEFKPPEWVPIEWKAPEFSGFKWSDFDDTDWPGGDNEISFGFATDTSRWDEWIDKIGRRKLQRLARQAGFYDIAEALKNWKYILDNYNDPDWVRQAIGAPGCSPTQGCGVNYSGRWGIGLAQVELGRLISQSRDVFSTAGLSDIAIFGFDLEYMLRDFGLEDGDIVEIVITQFGRELFRQELSLLNAGTDFDIRLNPGVASLTITALNEGAISPNTAQITIEDVAEGESDQSYSLLEGETAVLRVETGR